MARCNAAGTGIYFAAMGQFSEEESSVGRYYDGPIYEGEITRLPRDCPVEFAITCRWLERLATSGMMVAEIGVGGAHYTEILARKGCRLHLVDVSERLLESAVRRLQDAGLERQIVAVHHESGAQLAGLEPASVDLTLLLGPLYHLRSPEDRRHCVRESARILKPGGTLLAAGINRLSYLRDLFRESPLQASQRRAFHDEYLRDGNLDPEHAPPIGYAHLTTIAEFRASFEGLFEEQALVGAESFTTAWQKKFGELPLAEREAEAWLDLVEQTGNTPEGLAQSDHFLFVGRKL